MTNGHEAIGEDPVAVASLEQALEVGYRAAPSLAQVTTNMAEAGARMIFDVAIDIEHGLKSIAKIVHAGERLGQADDGSGDRRGRSRVGCQARGGLEKGNHDDQIAAVENAPGNPGPVEDRADIRAVDWRRADFRQRRARLAGRFDRFTDWCERSEWFSAQCRFPTHSGPRLLCEQPAG